MERFSSRIDYINSIDALFDICTYMLYTFALLAQQLTYAVSFE